MLFPENRKVPLKKKGADTVVRRPLFIRLYLLFLFVTAVEFINAAGCIYEFHLTCVERVGCA